MSRTSGAQSVQRLPERAEEFFGICVHDTVMQDLSFEYFKLLFGREGPIDEEVGY